MILFRHEHHIDIFSQFLSKEKKRVELLMRSIFWSSKRRFFRINICWNLLWEIEELVFHILIENDDHPKTFEQQINLLFSSILSIWKRQIHQRSFFLFLSRTCLRKIDQHLLLDHLHRQLLEDLISFVLIILLQPISFFTFICFCFWRIFLQVNQLLTLGESFQCNQDNQKFLVLMDLNQQSIYTQQINRLSYTRHLF